MPATSGAGALSLVLTKFLGLQRHVLSQHLCQTEPGEQFPCGGGEVAACCASLHPSAAFPGCPGQAQLPALPLRNVCALGQSWVGSCTPDKHISLKILLPSLTHSLSWSPFLQGGEAGVNQHKAGAHRVPGWKNPGPTEGRGWLWSGRTVQLLICVPLIQRMETFPWMRAVGTHTQNGTALNQPSWGGCRCELGFGRGPLLRGLGLLCSGAGSLWRSVMCQ